MNHTATAARTSGAPTRKLKKLLAEAHTLVADASSEKPADAIRALQARLATGRARLGELYAGARDKVTAGAKGTDEAIRAHPYRSLAIAAGLGMLLGALIARRSDSR
ncbi:DUF883 family protein [Opitutus terrae]|uniref:DUF883 domain-containing protein n=1 Tax=Opitutus terrae (strain DSM 11246 / JCM 15787 / PB90-1) TaxID=452637 RepID=B1ZPK7_OPITP|nr:DUF883 family protein [Opitutus terrae]ACB74526.1 protein of unknown function DUF883 ElaB [Opitutus terrae PB90-1]